MQSSDFVLDASVLVAGIRPGEPFYAEARTALEALTRQSVNLYVPTIVLAEVAAAIARGSGNASQAAQEVDLVRKMTGMQIVAVDGPLGDRAASVAALQRIRGCDAVYVALAEQRAAILITLDNEQRLRAPATVQAQTPREILAQLSST